MFYRANAVLIYRNNGAAVYFRLPITAVAGFCRKNEIYALILYDPVIDMVMTAKYGLGRAEFCYQTEGALILGIGAYRLMSNAV